MKLLKSKTMLFCLLTGFGFSNSVIAADFPDVTVEGLKKLSDTELAVVYARDGVDLGVYTKVWLVDAAVAFKEDWMRDQNRSYAHRINSRDMEDIKEGVAELFREVFTEKLTEDGHSLVNVAGEDVLIVRPAIINLDVVAPDAANTGRGYQLSQSAGEMTLYIELYDSVTSELLVKALDRQVDDSAFMQWQTRSSNISAAKRMLREWADTLSSALTDAQSSASKSKD